ncbi:hypothetical protein QQ045_010744 [Rhodiola kirilowii]
MEREVEVLSEKVQGELVVSVKKEVIQRAEESFRWAVFLKLSNGGEFNASALVAAMKKAWNIDGNLSFQEMYQNRVVVKLRNEEEFQRVLEGGPWTFMQGAVIAERWRKGARPNDYSSTKIRMWLQVHNVSPELREGTTPLELASLAGRVIKDELQDRKKDFQRRKCDRFRIEVDVTVPLRTGVYLQEEDNREPTWIEFRYERLPNICSRCGRLNHEVKDCSFEVDDPVNKKKFGPHLRADYQKPEDPDRVIAQRRCALVGSMEAGGGSRDLRSGSDRRLGSPTAGVRTGALGRPEPLDGCEDIEVTSAALDKSTATKASQTKDTDESKVKGGAELEMMKLPDEEGRKHRIGKDDGDMLMDVEIFEIAEEPANLDALNRKLRGKEKQAFLNDDGRHEGTDYTESELGYSGPDPNYVRNWALNPNASRLRWEEGEWREGSLDTGSRRHVLSDKRRGEGNRFHPYGVKKVSTLIQTPVVIGSDPNELPRIEVSLTDVNKSIPAAEKADGDWDALWCRLGFKGCLSVKSRGKAGGLALLWTDGVDIELQSYSCSHIDVWVKGDTEFFLTVFYGSPRVRDRIRSWSLLRKLSRGEDKAWAVMGDFNEVMFRCEVVGKRERQGWQMNNFRNCLHDCGLADLGAEGDRFTYSNRRRGENEVKACLDRVVVNQAWRSLFPNAVVRHSVANTSDHKPIVLYTSERVKTCKEKVVRFEPMWLRHKDFKNRVQEYWKELEGVNDMAEKLRRCMQRLNRWNWSVFGNVRKRIDSLKERLQCVRNMPRTHDRVEEEAQLSNGIDEWLEREELLWRQRSRSEWLIGGDRNTPYFHAKASQRKKRSYIKELRNSAGELCSDSSDISDIITNYFLNLFNLQANNSIEEWSWALNIIPKLVTEEMNAVLLAPFSEAEVKRALFQMHPTKAPGLDGLSAIFYQSSWEIVGGDVIKEALKCLNEDYYQSFGKQTENHSAQYYLAESKCFY